MFWDQGNDDPDMKLLFATDSLHIFFFKHGTQPVYDRLTASGEKFDYGYEIELFKPEAQRKLFTYYFDKYVKDKNITTEEFIQFQ